MAQQLDVTTVTAVKCRALLSGATANDVTTKLRKFLDSTIATDGASARKDLTTRLWLVLPKT